MIDNKGCGGGSIGSRPRGRRGGGEIGTASRIIGGGEQHKYNTLNKEQITIHHNMDTERVY